MTYTDGDGNTQSTEEITVTQKGRSNYASVVGSKSITIGAKDTTSHFSVRSNATYTLSVRDSEDEVWIKLGGNTTYERTEGTESTDEITVTFVKNPGFKERDGSIDIKVDGILKESVHFTQNGTPAKAEVTSSRSFELGYDAYTKGESAKVTVTSNVALSISEIEYVTGDSSWLEVTLPNNANHGDDHSESTEKIFVIKAKSDNNTRHNRIAKFTVTYINGDNNMQSTETITVTQKYSDIPVLSFNNENKEITELDGTFILEKTIGEEVTLSVKEFDKMNEWNFIWFVNGNPNSTETNSLIYENSKKEKGTVSVRVAKKDSTVTSELITVSIYPRPLSPTSLTKKGNGNSRIMIATIEGIKEESLERDEYQFVFNYGNVKLDSVSDRYYQYPGKYNLDNVDSIWVYTQWVVAGHTVRSEKEINAKGESRSTMTRSEATQSIKTTINGEFASIERGRLTAHPVIPSRAVVTVLSANGTVVKRMEYAPRHDYDEQIDLNGLPSGLYILRCQIGDMRAEEKIVVK